jgi:hypothetical protein
MDEQARQIRSIDVSQSDLYGVSVVGDGALMVGAQGLVLILAGGDLQPYARGIDEDLRAVVGFGLRSAWAVGQDGITYRLDDRGWSAIASGQTRTLHAVAVGDGGAVVRYDSGWHPVASGVDVDLRDVIVQPALWIAGNRGTLLTGTLDALRRVDLGTTCDLVAVFPSGDDIFVVGAEGPAGAVWRLRNGAIASHWGGC